LSTLPELLLLKGREGRRKGKEGDRKLEGRKGRRG